MRFRLRCLGEPDSVISCDRATCDSATTATNTLPGGVHVAHVARATPCDKPSPGPESVAHVAVSHVAPACDSRDSGLERRRARLERELVEHPEQRVAVDVADAPLRSEPGEPVSIVIAVRTLAGIVSAEMHIPRDRFDPALFLRTLTETAGRPS